MTKAEREGEAGQEREKQNKISSAEPLLKNTPSDKALLQWFHGSDTMKLILLLCPFFSFAAGMENS